MFGAAPESPNCGAGRLPRQVRFPPTKLCNSMPSGSLVVFPMKVTLPATWSRSDPSQHVCRPITLRLPPIELSSKSVYWGLPFGPWLSAASSDHGAGMGALKHPLDSGGPPSTPPPPPSTEALPPMGNRLDQDSLCPDGGEVPA